MFFFYLVIVENQDLNQLFQNETIECNKLNVIWWKKDSLGLILKTFRKTAAHKQDIHNTWECSFDQDVHFSRSLPTTPDLNKI